MKENSKRGFMQRNSALRSDDCMVVEHKLASCAGERCCRHVDMELVFHPIGNSGEETSTAFADAVGRVLETDKAGEIHIVCPYLSGHILSNIVQNRAFKMITDIEACFKAGADETLADFFEHHLDSVRHLNEVHAKVITTNGAALLGSANFTQSGIGKRDEMGCLIYNVHLVRTLRCWFDELWSTSKAITISDILSYQHHPPKPHDRCIKELNKCHDSTPDKPARSLGWLAPRKKPTLPEQSEADDTMAVSDTSAMRGEGEVLAAQLKGLTRSRAEALRVLELLAKALQIAGLPINDERLHLNFGKTPICVNINQRYVAWCSVERGMPQFGFILDSKDVANEAVESLQRKAWVGSFKKKGVDDLPTLHVPLTELPKLHQKVLDSWQRAIQIEVGRRCKDGRPCISSYRKYLRPYLFDVLRKQQIREEVVRRAFTEY